MQTVFRERLVAGKRGALRQGDAVPQLVIRNRAGYAAHRLDNKPMQMTARLTYGCSQISELRKSLFP